MAVQDYKINYKSDFVLTINGDAGWAIPFCIKFWTGAPSQAYFVGFDGVKYVNCRIGDDPTKLVVLFDDHHLPIGELKMQIAYHTTIEEFPGSVFDEVTNARDVIVTIDGTDYQVMLDFTGEDAPELEFNLPAYANEAERIQNELQRQQNEADRIAAELQREQATATAVQGAENVNAQLNGTSLTVTNRQGVSTSVNTKGEQGEQGPVGPEGPQGEMGISIVSFLPKSETSTTLIYTATFSDGHTQDVAIPKGPKGDTGATGPTGPQGQTGVSITGLVKTGETETDTLYNITFSNGTTQQVAIPKGEKGDTGDQGPVGPQGPQGPMGDVSVITPEQQAVFTMYSVTGQNTDGPMTQKAVTDALVAGSISYDNSQSVLAAENVQGAIDEIVNFIPSQETPVSYPASVSGVEFGTNGNWASQASRELKFIPYTYKDGDTLKIVTGQYNCSFAFLTSNSHVAGQPIPYCQGTTRGSVIANSTGIFAIPSDCLYICVYAAWTTTSVLPTSMSIVSRHIITEEEVDEKVEVVDSKYSPLELIGVEGLLLPSTITNYMQLSYPNWVRNTSVKSYAIPYIYKQGDIFNAVGNVSQGAFAFLTSDSNIAQGQPVAYCSGESGAHTIPANQQISIPIPQDCRCIYIYATWGTGSNPTQILPTNMYISNESVIDADEIKDAIDKTYFIHAGAPKLEWHHSGFIKADGTYGMIALYQYDVFKISGFVGNEDMALRYYASGNVPSALIFDDTDTIIGTIDAPSSASPTYRNVRVNLNNYPNAKYVLLNTYQYAEHLSIDLTPYSSFEERYPAYVEALKNEILSQISNKKSISIFFIGNSLTQDTIGYLPIILKELAPEVEFKIYDWYNAGAKLEQQYAKFVNNEPCQSFSKCENVISWTNIINTVTINDILSNYDFDIVCLQEYSYFDFTESQLITNFNNIVSFISEHYAKPLKYVCLIDQPNRSKVSAMYAQSVSYAKTFLKSTVCEDILNPGGALFLALQTSLDSLGDQGHLSPDGTHAQEGLPCVLQSYVHALWILDKLGIAKSIYNSQTRITAENYPSINVCGPNLGTGVVEGTDEQYRIAQQCAIKAYKLSRKYVNEVLETLPETI